MKKYLSAIVLAMMIMTNICNAQPPSSIWTQNIGGEQSESLTGLDHAYFGGYVTVGTEFLNVNGDSARIAILRFDDYGNILWQQHCQPGNISQGCDIQRTWDNSTYIVTGTSKELNTSTMTTAHLINIDGQGNVLWTGNYDPGQMSTETRVACAYSGEFILLGNIYDQVLGYNIRLTKVSSGGTTIWTKTLGGYYRSGKAIVAGYDPGFYIAGSLFSFPNMSNDNYLVKINSNGDTLWTKAYGDSGIHEQLVDIKRTTDGKLIAVGNRFMGTQGNQIALIKFDLDGNVIWTRYIGAYEDFFAGSVIQDTDNGYLISGSTQTSSGSVPILVKTNANGYVRWITETSNGNSTIGGFADALPCNYPGGYMAVGSTNEWSIFTDMYLAKINSDPQAPITATPFASDDIALPFTGGQFDFSVTVTNESSYSQVFDVWTIIDLPNVGQVPVLTSLNRTLSSLGSFTKTLTQNIPANAPGGIYTYKIYLGVYPYQIYYYDSFTFIKSGNSGDGGLDQEGWGCTGWFDENSANIEATIPATMQLSNSPNPFNPTTTINYALPNSGTIILRVYDINGRQVAELINGNREAGAHSVTFDGSALSSGIYIYQLQAGSNTVAGKMMLVK